VCNRTLLGSDLLDTTLEICTGSPIALVHTRHEHWRVGEEVLHLFKRTLGGLGKEAVEEECIGEVADLV
jgi:hypothetical protein